MRILGIFEAIGILNSAARTAELGIMLPVAETTSVCADKDSDSDCDLLFFYDLVFFGVLTPAPFLVWGQVFPSVKNRSYHGCKASPFDILYPHPAVIKRSNGTSPVFFACSLGHGDFLEICYFPMFSQMFNHFQR